MTLLAREQPSSAGSVTLKPSPPIGLNLLIFLQRLLFAPQLPTISEQGLTGYQIFTWWGIFGPAGLPPAIVARLNAELVVLLDDPAFKDKAFRLGYGVRSSSPEKFGAFAKAEYAKWGEIVTESGMRPDE